MICQPRSILKFKRSSPLLRYQRIMDSASEERSRKRRRLSNGSDHTPKGKELPRSVTGSVSPPPLRNPRPQTPNTHISKPQTPSLQVPGPQSTKVMRSPFQLTWIRDLPEASNVDAVSLKDILGDPLIKECWEFNYLHDLDFLMEAFDNDVRDLVKVNVVHGFWKKEDHSRLNLLAQAAKYPNITLHAAYMPEAFGTHHSKMLVLIRHDSTAQIIIHTANMIPFDWTNMTQALWKSPLLPEIANNSSPSQSNRIGSGSKFKTDFINYLKAYDSRRMVCRPLIEQILKYDFSEIRAALVASVPGREGIERDSETAWGWVGIKKALSSVPVKGNGAEIVVQISSIATLGPDDKWLDKTFFKALGTSKNFNTAKSKFRIIFPTADEIRRSLNGYRSGSAIHIKIQSAAQTKQLQYLKPMLSHWAGDGAQHSGTSSTTVSDAGRKRAAPHIKTYIRFADADRSSIDWMLVTSANLSKQAWGEALKGSGDVRICSYEIGVLVWPELFGEHATMVPTFGEDTPPTDKDTGGELVVGARMPYDLPIVPYARGDVPWCATASYSEPDWKGETWNVE